MTSAIGKIFGGGSSSPPPAPLPPPPPVAKATQDAPLREQKEKQRATGAEPDEAEADFLGYAAPKKRSAGREILG